MGIATVLKMNCLIFLIAIICFLFYNIFDSILEKKEFIRKGIISFAFAAMVCVGVWGCNKVVNGYVERLSGYKMPEGEAFISWIAMGLSEAELGPGFYNGFINHVFVKYNYDTEKIIEASIEEIKESLHELGADPLNVGIPFFARKTAFQWNDPTFISIDRMKFRTSAFMLPNIVRDMIDGNLAVQLSGYLNYFQTLVWVGVLIYLIKNRNSSNIYELFGIVIFLGGFLFHMIWEASASYTLPYFTMLIPYAVKGYMDITLESGQKSFGSINIKAKGGNCIILITVFVIIAIFSRTALFSRTIALNDGEDAEKQFYHSYETEKEIANQVCYVMPRLSEGYVLTDQGEPMIVAVSETEEEPDKKFLIELTESGIKLRYIGTGRVLAADYADETSPSLITYMDDELNLFYEKRASVDFIWELEQIEGNMYYIISNDWALTLRDGELRLESKSADEVQQWVFKL